MPEKMDSLDHLMLKDARICLKKRKESLDKKSKDLDEMVKKDVVDEKKLKRDLAYLKEVKILNKKEEEDLVKMKPLEAQKITNRLISMLVELEQLVNSNVISPNESEKIKTLSITEKLRWVTLLKVAYLQENQGWLDADDLDQIRKSIGLFGERTEKWLSANGEVKQMIDMMERNRELSPEDAKKYRDMKNPIKALDELKTQRATEQTLREMREIFGE